MEVDPSFVPYRLAALHLRKQLEDAGMPMPVVGIICGSGLSELSNTLTGETLTVPYGSVPGFPDHCSVEGHKGEMVFGNMESTKSLSSPRKNSIKETVGTPTVCFRGRFHSYEGHDIDTVVLPVRVMRCLGVKILLVTNAAGGLNASYKVGDVVPISNHFCLPMLAGAKNPLVGPNDDELGPRFPPTSNAYDQNLLDNVSVAANLLSMDDFVLSKTGTYCFVSGPMYESRAECKFLQGIGGDVVGMSSMPEVVTAHHSGMKILCLSLVTNKVVITGDEGPAASHQEVLDAVKTRSVQIQALVKEIIGLLQSNGTLAKLPPLPPVTLHVKAKKENRGKHKCASSSIFGIPTHCIVRGLAYVGIGALLGVAIAKR
eukprot:scaffold18739_cov52-Attheya_sp.AAC.3